MTDIKGIVTNVKTVIGLITVIISLITWTLYQSNRIGDLNEDLNHYKEVYDVKLGNIENLLEKIDEAIGFNRNYIMNQLTPKITRASEIR